MDFDDIIAYENESTRLDFKAIQYDKSKHKDFIKDVMSMANANIKGERYIIIGVNHKSNGDRDIIPIEKENFIDAAIYQQLIRENIEPDIALDYYPYNYNGKLLGIYKIYDCNDGPYMMRKKYKNLKKGDCYIRKGTHQTPMQRKDIDQIIHEKISNKKFSGDIKIGFIDTDYKNKIELAGIEKIELPSQKAAKKINRIIKKKKSEVNETNEYKNIIGNLNKLANPFSPTPYEERTLEQLENNLDNIKEDYLEDDLYKLFTNSHKINFEILNEGNTYIEDASFKVKIPSLEEIFVFSKYHEEPKNKYFFVYNINEPLSFGKMKYPSVKKQNNSILIHENIGDIKHHIPKNVFKIPLRIWLSDDLKEETLELVCELFGKNLIEPLKEKLKIKII